MKTLLNVNNPLRITVMYPVNTTGTPQVFEVPWQDLMKESEAKRIASSIDDKDQIDVLELVFRHCNHVDDTEWIAGKKLRSMGLIGDIVFIDTVTDEYEPENRDVWVCMGNGWKRIDDLEITL